MRISGISYGVNVGLSFGPGAVIFAARLDDTGEVQILRARIYSCKRSNSAGTAAENSPTVRQPASTSISARDHSKITRVRPFPLVIFSIRRQRRRMNDRIVAKWLPAPH